MTGLGQCDEESKRKKKSRILKEGVEEGKRKK